MNNIITEIQNFLTKYGGNYRDWYSGIALNPRQRLFSDHNVIEKSDAWIYRDCSTASEARVVEKYFLNKGCIGDEGGGDWLSKYVYAYKISSHSKE